MCRVIVACGVLHNLCIEANIPPPDGDDDIDGDDDDNEEIMDEDIDPHRDALDGITARSRIVQGFN